MDAMNVLAIILRVCLVIFSPILSLMAYNIYRKTKGGSLGWVYLTITFVSLGVWALSQLVFLFLYDSAVIRNVIGAVMFFIMAVFNPLSAVTLAKDMGCKIPGWLSLRNIIIGSVVFVGVFYAYNMGASPEIMGSANSISVLLVLPTFIIASFGYNRLAKETGVGFWKWLTWGCIVILIGALMISSSYTDCCGTGSPLHDSEECATWNYDYASALPLPCFSAALPLTSNGAAFVLIGMLMVMVGMEKIRKAMKA